MSVDVLAPDAATRSRRLPRDLHPGAWWLWAIGLAAAASFTWNPFILGLIVAVTWLVVASRRTEAPWALSFHFYLWFGVAIIVIRMVTAVLFGPALGGIVLVPLPEVPLPEVARGITLLGDITLTDLLFGFYNGLRLAVIVICIGAANALANPKRLLAHLPPALYEAGTLITVALSVFPQLVESTRRVLRARDLRGEARGRINGLRRVVVPVLEDALERSMTLAAGMDSRGYGRTGALSRRTRIVNGTIMLGSLIALAIGAYGYLDGTAPRWMAWPMLVVGVLGALLGMRLAGQRVARTRYRPDRWRLAETMTVACGFAAAFGVNWSYNVNPWDVNPGFDRLPTLSLVAVAAVLIAVIPAFATPEPRRLR